jgi:hypothetical protein
MNMPDYTYTHEYDSTAKCYYVYGSTSTSRVLVGRMRDVADLDTIIREHKFYVRTQ